MRDQSPRYTGDMPRRHHWNFQRNLARRIALRDGTRLRTLNDARTLLLDKFDRVNAKSSSSSTRIADPA